MRILKFLAIAFTLYSRIPMPRFEWKEEDMAYSLAFFPLVGVVIGGGEFWLNGILPFAGLPAAVRILLTLALPIIITGGIHMDGFMDVEDALRSYAAREKKLEILKDPHIGAFAVISLVKWMLLYGAAVTAVLLHPKADGRVLAAFGLCFVTSRCCSGLTSLFLKKAKKDGMLYEETKSRSGFPLFCLILFLGISLGLLFWANVILACAILTVTAVWTVWYRYLSYKQFGGVTGDTAGYYLTILEILSVAVMAACLYCFG
ncbi:MAG: adenosylcobinamide-GDP ribazoletransferase [Lachnospiraceae bacterium]|nr:adenosylcobinamide-GDP ribazoletransferase [Lachnospiraceae bacterium]